MMPLRILAGIVASAALVGFVARAFGPAAHDAALAPVPSAGEPAPPSDPPALGADAAQGEPLPAAHFSGAERPHVPAGILARAADARALERGPSCPPPAAALAPPVCAPEGRESIEIEWHVAQDR
jgi:hypothetical protein